MKQLMTRLGGLVFLAALTACGGGGGDPGCSVFSSGCTSATASDTAASSSTGNVATSSSGTVVLSMSSTTISASSPGTVTALVKKADGSPLANTLVTFTVANGTATVSPPRVITDAQGNASATLQPVAGSIGADYVSAVADFSTTSTLSTRSAFTVSAVNVALDTMSASPAAVDAYGSTVVTVNVTGASSASPVTVNFSSTCATSGKATLSPTSVTVTGATASTTYQDKACSSTDRVNASISGTSQQKQVDVAVTAPTAQSLEFVSASPDKICLAGSGCEVSSVVSFRLKDQYNNPIAGREISFALDVPNVATLSSSVYKTNASGIAQVSVTAKTIPSPVRVRAELALDSTTKLSTVSNALAINAGLPTQRAFSFSADTYNVDGWAKDGTESGVRVQLNDRFANPVPDGTSISFVAEGASIIPARCTTTNGVCTVKFVSSNYRPSNGRVTVVAFAQGEESFNDANGNNLYDLGEVFDDLGPVFVDKDENNKMASQGEYLIGDAANGAWDKNTYVRQSRVFILADSSMAPRLFTFVNGACTSTPYLPQNFVVHPAFTDSNGAKQPAVCGQNLPICIRDSNTDADPMGGNPIPGGAVLSMETKSKGAATSVDGTPVTSTANFPTRHLISVELDDCTKGLDASGSLYLNVKMPAGQNYKMAIGTVTSQ